jgi:hypothetical protein
MVKSWRRENGNRGLSSSMARNLAKAWQTSHQRIAGQRLRRQKHGVSALHGAESGKHLGVSRSDITAYNALGGAATT